MRLGDKKIIYIRKSRQSKRRFSFFLIVLLTVSVIIYSGIYFLDTVRPVIISNAKSKAHRIAQKAINDAVIKLLSNEEITYEDVINLKRSDDGIVVAAESNLEGINILKSKITMEIQDYISGLGTAEISFPVGAFFGTDILAGVGPKVSLEFMPDGMAEVEFLSKFEDSGINQTKLSIDLLVKTTVGLLIPGGDTNIEVKTTVPVVRTVIVGDIPGSYTNVERDGESYEDDVLELAE